MSTNETKREKFIRLAENRTQSVLKGIDLLANLANPNAYEYTKEDLDKVVNAIKDATIDLEMTFGLAAAKKQQKFKL